MESRPPSQSPDSPHEPEGTGNPDPAWVALISTDADFRTRFHRILDDPEVPGQLALAIDCPFSAVSDVELQELERADPALVVVDLGSDPRMGLEFIQSLIDSGNASSVVAAGSDLSQDLLLQAIQVGVMEVLSKPLDEDHARQALNRVLSKAGRAPRMETGKGEGRIMAFFGAKGGVGTTALATNLAVEVRRLTGKRTLLLDLDVEQGETALLLGMEPRFTLLDLLRNYQKVVSGLLASCIDHHEPSGIDLLAAPLRTAPVQPEDLELLSGDRMREVLDFLRDHYDYVIIDRPKSFHPAFNCVLEEADERYMVTTPDLQALRNVTRSLPSLSHTARQAKGDPIRLVVNRYPPNHVISLEDIRETVGLEAYHHLGADFFPINESIHERTPAVLRENSQFAQDVKELARKVTGLADAEAAGSKKGLLGGILDAVRNR
jgi:pilus assembly protein CpaE